MKPVIQSIVRLALLLALLGAAPQPLAAAAPEGAETGPGSEAPSPEETPDAPEVPPLISEAEELLELNGALMAKFQDLSDQSLLAEGDDRLILERQIMELKLEYLQVLGRIVDNLLAQERAGFDASELRRVAETEIERLGPAIERHIEESEQRLKRMRAERGNVAVDELVAYAQETEAEEAWLRTLYRAYLEHTRRMAALGMDAGDELDDLTARVLARAENLGGRLSLISEQVGRLKLQAAEKPDDAALTAELAGVQTRKKTVAESLRSTIKLMDELGLDAAEYQRLLITATGDVTSDIFRARVALGLMEQGAERFRAWLLENGPTIVVRIILFVLVLAAFKLLSVVARRVLERAFAGERVRASQLLRTMSISLLSNAILFLGLLVGLSQLGFDLGPILAGLGVAGFIVGFALQDSLSNFAAGMMILGYRPFDVGDLIEAGGVFGTVHNMSLVSTTILTIDNQTLIVPNAKIWGDVIKNVTHQDRRRVDMKFAVSYRDDVEHAERVLAAILDAHPRVLKDPEPMVRLHELGENSMHFVVRPWVATGDYWDVYWDVTREVKSRFDAEGISIPLPQRDVRLVDGKGAEGA